jgi:hypothetical protein
MNKEQKILSPQQNDLKAELCKTYGIEPDDIIFFTDDPKPFFGYEASCILLNALTDIVDRELEPVPPVLPDSISRRCRLVFPDGSSSNVGVVNLQETGEDDRPLSTQQLEWLADSRAIRGAIRAKSIDLLRLHYAAKQNDVPDRDRPLKSQRATLISQSHALGKQAFLIVGDDKSLWYRTLRNRYEGKAHANELNDEQLADWVAFLGMLVKPAAAAA